MAKKKKPQFEGIFVNQIQAIFGKLTEYRENEENKTVYIQIAGYEFDAERLFELSDLLGTRQIFTEHEHYESHCGNNTCDFSEDYINMSASNVVF